MSVPSRTRQEVVTKIVELLSSRLKLSDDIVEEVYPYVPSDPQGLSPIVAVAAIGSQREGLGSSRRQMTINLAIYIYVLYTHTGGDIDEQKSWAALNQIEQAISETLDANKTAEGFWYNLMWLESSSVDVLILDNQGYLLESILTQVNVT